MAYPRPLSSKTILKMLEEAQIDNKKADFLYELYHCASNLYGIIMLEELWNVYKALKSENKYPSIKKKELIAFSDIVRRQNLPYRVYEMEEIYKGQKEGKEFRLLIKKDLTGQEGFARDELLYIDKQRYEYPFYVPKDILVFTDDYETLEAKNFRICLENLICKQKYITNEEGRKIRNPNFRKKLKDYSYMDQLDYHILRVYSENNSPYNRKKLEEFKNNMSLPASMRIYTMIVKPIKKGYMKFTLIVSMLFDYLQDAGAEVDEREANMILKYFMDMYNNTHQFSMGGWAPHELALAYPPNPDAKPSIMFGENLERMFAEGEIDREEYEKAIRDAGLEVFDPDKNH
ncbi:MAG: hypothetical protein J6E46_03925 [Faecalicoccus sp.]|nr:hypothetical protein [Faecalicoccus sp.]